MRVLQSLTGNATHMDGRERLYTDRDGNAKVALAEGPLCNGVGASRGNVRWYERKAKAVTCKSCLRILAKVHAEALAMHAAYMMTPEGQAQEDALAARRAEKCGQCGSERSNPRHHSAEGHAFTAELPAAEWSGMQVELATGKRYVEAGERVQHKDSGERGTVTAVGPNALDLEMADGTPRSVASWFWEIQDEPAPEAGPIDRQAVLATRVDSLLDSGVHGTCPEQRILAKVHAEALAMHAEAEVQAVPAAAGEDVAAMTGDPVGWVTSMLKDEEERSGMYVELSSGLTEYVEPGERLQHKDSGARGTVTAVGPNALDLRMDNDTAWSGASWFWGRPSADGPAESGPIDRQAVLATRVDSLMDSGVTDAQRLAELEQEGPLSRQLRALGSQAGSTVVKVLGDGSTVVDMLEDEQEATPAMVAELTTTIAEQAELFAAGGVSSDAAGAFRSRMVGNVRTLARWLGMSEPVELASFASPYGGPDLVDDTRRAHRSSLEVSSARIVEGVRAARTRAASMPLCRRPSSRWTTYGATCNTPLAADGTCPEQHLHV